MVYLILLVLIIIASAQDCLFFPCVLDSDCCGFTRCTLFGCDYFCRNDNDAECGPGKWCRGSLCLDCLPINGTCQRSGQCCGGGVTCNSLGRCESCFEPQSLCDVNREECCPEFDPSTCTAYTCLMSGSEGRCLRKTTCLSGTACVGNGICIPIPPPTPAPTNKPTPPPTRAPTRAPTKAPTSVPTMAPTEACLSLNSVCNPLNDQCCTLSEACESASCDSVTQRCLLREEDVCLAANNNSVCNGEGICIERPPCSPFGQVCGLGGCCPTTPDCRQLICSTFTGICEIPGGISISVCDSIPNTYCDGTNGECLPIGQCRAAGDQCNHTAQCCQLSDDCHCLWCNNGSCVREAALYNCTTEQLCDNTGTCRTPDEEFCLPINNINCLSDVQCCQVNDRCRNVICDEEEGCVTMMIGDDRNASYCSNEELCDGSGQCRTPNETLCLALGDETCLSSVQCCQFSEGCYNVSCHSELGCILAQESPSYCPIGTKCSNGKCVDMTRNIVGIIAWPNIIGISVLLFVIVFVLSIGRNRRR